jgi:hypothetical protein
MIFDTAGENIILVSYPSGGFGNFIYYVLTRFADQTVKVPNLEFNFSTNGNSHAADKYTNTYFHDPIEYISKIDFDPKDKKILILCDNGINNDNYTKVKTVFPNATIVRVVIESTVRPVIYQTCVIKAIEMQHLNVENQPQVNAYWSDAETDYAQRENFTLFYHNWPFGWQPLAESINLSLEELVTNPVATITNLIGRLGMKLVDEENLQSVVNDWVNSNSKYFSIYHTANNIMQALELKENIDISSITNLHDQGYINYCIEAKFHVTIPVYDYKDWFKSTNEITKMVEKLHV